MKTTKPATTARRRYVKPKLLKVLLKETSARVHPNVKLLSRGAILGQPGRPEQILKELELKQAEIEQGHLPQTAIDEPWQQEMSAEDRKRVWQQSSRPAMLARLKTCIKQVELDAMRPMTIKEYRESIPLSQSDLAVLTGVSERQIRRLEKGECTPDAVTRKALADAFSNKLERTILPADVL